MKYIEINNITYGFAIDFKHNQEIRTSFNELTEATFGFNLESWYINGFWGSSYIPYSLLYNNKVISNVSVNKIEFDIENEKKIGIQIGTVMTHEQYRHQGFNKFILEFVINEWKNKADFIYLFANDSVLDFYPKFNFEKVDEYLYSKSVCTPNTPSLKLLNMENKNDTAFLIETVKKSIPMSKVSMRNNVSLIIFYCMLNKKNSVYHLEKHDAIVIADFEGDTLYLNEVFSKESIELDDLIKNMAGEDIKRVVLGFTPLNETGFNRSVIKEGDTLFMLKDEVNHFKDNYWMFPVLSHA